MFEATHYDNVGGSKGKSLEAEASSALFHNSQNERYHLPFHNQGEGSSTGLGEFPDADELLAGLDEKLGLTKNGTNGLSMTFEHYSHPGQPPAMPGYAPPARYAEQSNVEAVRDADSINIDHITGEDGRIYDVEHTASADKYFTQKRQGGPDDVERVSIAVPPADVQRAAADILNTAENRFRAHDEAVDHLARLTEADGATVDALNKAICAQDFEKVSSLLQTMKNDPQHLEDVIYALKMEAPRGVYLGLTGPQGQPEKLRISQFGADSTIVRTEIDLQSGAIDTRQGAVAGPVQAPIQRGDGSTPGAVPPQPRG